MNTKAGKCLHLIFPFHSAILAAYTTTQDTFYIDPDVVDHGSLAARATQLGLKMKGSLEEGVTVWVTTGLAREKNAEGAAADSLRGRRTSRIHRMVRFESGLFILFLDFRGVMTRTDFRHRSLSGDDSKIGKEKGGC